jgi:hypothetical protein
VVDKDCPDAGTGAPMADISAVGVLVAVALILLVVAARLEKL